MTEALAVSTAPSLSPALTLDPPKLWPQVDSTQALTIDSTLVQLATYGFESDPAQLANAIDDTFRQHTEIPGVMLVKTSILMGVISRRRFFEILGQLYGTALFLKRPIETMLDPISRQWLQISSTTTIDQATQLVFQRPERWVYEPIVVSYPNGTFRLLDVRVLLIAQTRLFANLQRDLRQSNERLEERVRQRTLELAGINNSLEDEVSRRRQTEDALVLARDQALQASHLKTELLAHVSHELRTPLGAVLGFSEMLSMGLYGPLNDKQRDIATRITESSRYLEGLVNDLLDQAQLTAGKYTLKISIFSPGDLLEPALAKIRVLAENKPITIVTDVAVNMPRTLSGDLLRLQQILLNLASNATKFTERGAIGIRLYRVGQNQWAMEVSDTGRGIPAEAQAYVFEPFRQVEGTIPGQQRGTGLGLSIVQQLVTLMDGYINLKSQLGHGSTFTVVLPIHTHT